LSLSTIGPPIYIWSLTSRAQLRCQTAQLAEGQSDLATLETLQDGKLPVAFQLQSDIYEARAACLLQAGEHSAALHNVEQELAVIPPPGRPVERAACLMLKARILAAMREPSEATAALDAAERVFLDGGNDRHPHLARVTALRADLRGQ
jgi:hypothetical protein